ncbi:MAG: RNA 2',3'-cyclic phosphodiesterase [Oscillospiraceae bacterium]|nr:RNA 2',3'-cyclic phosphodiesterase [Oscillospiraceae bacterium]
MRLFVAIKFSPEVHSALTDAIYDLKTQSFGGNFTKSENLHLTLAFIGETRDVGKAKDALDAVSASQFEIKLGGRGKFGDLYWAGLEKSPALSDIAAQVRRELVNRGFEIDTKPFKPHITLARQLRCDAPPVFDVYPASMMVEKISLMRSDRIDGRLRYTEIHSKKLGGTT